MTQAWNESNNASFRNIDKITDFFFFFGSKITADGDCIHEIKRCLLLGRKVITNLDSILKSRDITLSTKVHLVKAMVSLVVMYGCESWTIKTPEHLEKEMATHSSILAWKSPWTESDGLKSMALHDWACVHKGGGKWVGSNKVVELKKRKKKPEHWRIDAFELWCWRRLLRVLWTARRSNQSILKEISPGCSLEGLMLKLKLLILWLPDAKSWLIGKDPDAGRDWGQEEKGTTEDEMVGCHHWLSGHGFGWTPEVGDGQGGLACCGSCGCKESDMTEQLNWTELNCFLVKY